MSSDYGTVSTFEIKVKDTKSCFTLTEDLRDGVERQAYQVLFTKSDPSKVISRSKGIGRAKWIQSEDHCKRITHPYHPFPLLLLQYKASLRTIEFVGVQNKDSTMDSGQNMETVCTRGEGPVLTNRVIDPSRTFTLSIV